MSMLCFCKLGDLDDQITFHKTLRKLDDFKGFISFRVIFLHFFANSLFLGSNNSLHLCIRMKHPVTLDVFAHCVC